MFCYLFNLLPHKPFYLVLCVAGFILLVHATIQLVHLGHTHRLVLCQTAEVAADLEEKCEPLKNFYQQFFPCFKYLNVIFILVW